MATPSQFAITQRGAQNSILQDAIADFKGVLTDDWLQKFRDVQAVPNADAVLVFTAQLDSVNRSRRGQSYASRVHSFLSSVRSFCGVVDTFASVKPEVAALVWGSVKLTMEIILNYTSYFEVTSNLFLQLGKLFPLFAEYQALYPTSDRLRQSLYYFHASIIYCCKHLVVILQRSWPQQLVQAMRTSFEQEFKHDMDNIRTCSERVRDEIHLAKAQADRHDQELQALEREVSSNDRSIIKKALLNSSAKLERIRAMQLIKKGREHRERMVELVEAVSRYDYVRLLKQSRSKRFQNTTSWIFETSGFHRWIDGNGSLLWLTGKIGSGKSIAAGNVIDHIVRIKGSLGCMVSYFFIRSDDQESCTADAVLKSLIRQRLDPATISREDIPVLQAIHSSSSDIIRLLGRLMVSPRSSYIIVDGLDECDNSNQKQLLAALSSLARSSPNIRLFLSGRPSLDKDLRKYFKESVESLVIGGDSTGEDIHAYVEHIIDERIDDGDLRVRDPTLARTVKQTLIRGAQGMFLWVTLQVEELCSKHSDHDIRETLYCLPEDLEETYRRALQRIVNQKHHPIAQRVFMMIAASKQLLTRDELQEVLALEIGQKFIEPARMINDMDRIASWCGNLVQVDEEDQTVQFSHSSIREFLLKGPLNPELEGFHVDWESSDHNLGELCLTYIDLNNFRRIVARRTKPIVLGNPLRMAQPFLGSGKRMALFAKFSNTTVNESYEIEPQNFGTQPQSSLGVGFGHPFLKYASVYWIAHSENFWEEETKTWKIWKQIIFEGHELAKIPWQEAPLRDQGSIFTWALQNRHFALMRLVVSSSLVKASQQNAFVQKVIEDGEMRNLNFMIKRGLSSEILNFSLQMSAKIGNLNVIERLLTAGADVNAKPAYEYGRTALQAAAEGGHLNVVERLLATGADINAPAGMHGRTALQAAAKGGHLDVVERLLAAGADVNAEPARMHGRTALQAAAKGGHLSVVERLLASGADINALAGIHGRTALQAAAEGGHLGVVERLLAAGADVNAETARMHGRTALQAAAKGGHLDVVERLLASGADINAPAGMHGRTALQAAAEGGHLGVVERLLAAGADVNAPAGIHGRTALQAAAKGGHLDIVERLLASGADINALAGMHGRTALQAAAEGGYLGVVERLLAAGADVNAPAGMHGRTALQAATEGGHLNVVERLLDAGADINAEPAYEHGRTALQATAEGGHLDVVERLLDASADINAEPAYKYGRTALQAAAEGDHLDVVEKLLAAGADVNAEPAGMHGRTALQAAAKGGHLDIVERLLAAGADINAEPEGMHGRTALQATAEGGHLDVVERLLDAGADVNARPAYEHGWTALQAAAEGGYLTVVERLLAAGADVNARPAYIHGWTALQAAAEGGHLGVVERLLAAGADVNAPAGVYGRTALQAAAEGGHLDVVERLLADGADVNAEPAGMHGRTALQAAAEGGHLDVVERLLDAGADVNARPAYEHGWTALQAAAKRGYLAVVERLLAAGADVNAPAGVYGRTALQAAIEGDHLDIFKRLRAA
ncbi:ankyrin repeat-containing domain protein [Truncatella angustata]|uniref:Ankyrin repeat-containing domain protein n=1 Tax=Truncatella angustata TaxID=152316 RepID=A0A9P8RHI0_9PEZI|nr:ankyrin repeat-containing domain protein [Truncatella angustata]KAH6645914.1 ankyrin repeat-containing domain protein [Truncatella angustata]